MYYYKTKIGTFYITQDAEGWYHPEFEGEKLGRYFTPAQAAEDLSGGHTYSLSSGIDPAELDIPSDLSEWDRDHRR